VLAIGINCRPPPTTAAWCLRVRTPARSSIIDKTGHYAGEINPGNCAGELQPRAVPIELGAGRLRSLRRMLHRPTSNSPAGPQAAALESGGARLVVLFCGVTGLETFNADFVRGEPTPEPRLAPVPGKDVATATSRHDLPASLEGSPEDVRCSSATFDVLENRAAHGRARSELLPDRALRWHSAPFIVGVVLVTHRHRLG
jgi:hypothetical protein